MWEDRNTKHLYVLIQEPLFSDCSLLSNKGCPVSANCISGSIPQTWDPPCAANSITVSQFNELSRYKMRRSLQVGLLYTGSQDCCQCHSLPLCSCDTKADFRGSRASPALPQTKWFPLLSGKIPIGSKSVQGGLLCYLRYCLPSTLASRLSFGEKLMAS